MAAIIKLVQDILPGEYIRHCGEWIQVEKLEPGILNWWVHYDAGVFLIAHNTRVAVAQPELDSVEIVWLLPQTDRGVKCQ